jgi:hypothetical protein
LRHVLRASSTFSGSSPTSFAFPGDDKTIRSPMKCSMEIEHCDQRASSKFLPGRRDSATPFDPVAGGSVRATCATCHLAS